MVEPACSAPGLGRPSGWQDFSVSKSTPKAQTLGKLLIFLVIKTQVYLFSVFQNTNLSDFLFCFVLDFVHLPWEEQTKRTKAKSWCAVLGELLGSSWSHPSIGYSDYATDTSERLLCGWLGTGGLWEGQGLTVLLLGPQSSSEGPFSPNLGSMLRNQSQTKVFLGNLD